MKIVIIGTGYVGLVTGTCFAEIGNTVTCVDINTEKIENLRKGIMPIYEPGLEELVKKNVESKRLFFSTSLTDTLKDNQIIFSAVNTPPAEDGSADLTNVINVAKNIGQTIKNNFLLVNKSTVPVGTAKKVKEILREELDKRGLNIKFAVASNPEFLKEGAALKDFMSPDRVVIGTDDDEAKAILTKLYKPFMLQRERFIFMDVASAEMTKYAANAMLATRISFMNEIAALCEKVGANIDLIRKGIGTDERIGNKFLYAGAGFGGSCFPKDIRALISTGIEHGVQMRLIEAVKQINESQKSVVFNKLKETFGGILRGKTIAIWGLSYKPETDDIREAPALIVINKLLTEDAIVRAFDPIAMDETKKQLGDKITYCNDEIDAVTGADAVILMTEWRQFRVVSWGEIRKYMKGNVVIDGRNIYDAEELKAEGFIYKRIGATL